MPAQADYGIDAPLVVRNLLIGGAVAVVAGLILQATGLSVPHIRLGSTLVSSGVSCLICAGVMLWGSKVEKLHLRDKLISGIAWRGDEQVLDVGCGHGLMLIAAAKHLQSGRATGIDLWQTEDQAGNSRAATQRNIDLEGVTDRVDLHEADARALPFPDSSFDVVFSSWALHNIYENDGRAKALAEIVRVLKPDGRAFVTDIRHGSEYALAFRQAGMINLRRSLPNFLFVIPTTTISAQKPTVRAT